MCTRITEITLAPFRYIGNSIEYTMKKTSFETKIKAIAISIIFGILNAAFAICLFGGAKFISLPLITALAYSSVLALGSALGFLFLMTVMGRHMGLNATKVG